MKAIVNGQIVLEHEILRDHVILYDERIERILPQNQWKEQAGAEVFDAAGAFVSPGFINEHIHGCAGVDVMDGSEESMRIMRHSLAKTGTTAFLPTTMTYDFKKIYTALEVLRQAMQTVDGARVLGANVEGPFISEAYKGAHDPQYIAAPAFHLIKSYADVIKIMTVAPETVTEADFIEQCKAHHIILSLGHSAATYEQAIAAIDAGFTHITHMFNAMPVFNHRKPGVIGAAMDSGAVCELITDNIHVHPAMQRILLKGKSLEQIILVTDSMCACLMEDGEYELGGQPVIVKQNTAKLANGVIAGSVLTMNQAVKNFMENTGVTLPEALQTVTVNPAKELGVFDEIGSIQEGKFADLTVFDQEFNIKATMINGKIAYRGN